MIHIPEYFQTFESLKIAKLDDSICEINYKLCNQYSCQR